MKKASRITILLFIILIEVQTIAHAQEKDDYQKWLKREQEKFQEFKDARDKEFYEFLRHEWKQMQTFKGLLPDEKPKPRVLPTYKHPPEQPKEPVSKPATIKNAPPEIAKEKLSEESKLSPALISPTELRTSANALNINFFGTPVALVYDDKQKPKLGPKIDKESISTFWAAMSRSNYEEVLSQARQDRAQMKLNDWGYALLLHAMGEKIFDGSRNEALLFTWFALTKSGYDTKVGYMQDRIYLMLHTGNNLYYVPYMTLEKKRFYIVSLNPRDAKFEGALYTYDGNYTGADKSVDFKVETAPVLKQNVLSKTLKFVYDGKDYAIPVKFSQDAISFFENYPQTNYEVYFTAVPSPEASTSLFGSLKQIVQGKTEWEAVNTLLRFVQTAFEYKTDPEQFGREKPFFPEETLYYPYSDCEDRSILFAYLVRTLLGLEVVGLDYPAHIATAVHFNTEIAGDAITFQGKRYVICDPTYINADAGVCMPQFKGVNPNVIRIE